MNTQYAIRSTQNRWRVSWLLILILLIASALRLWQVGTLPPGLHYDEAADTIIAQQIARGESAPIFVEAYTGKEVLFFYWAAAWMKLIGPSVFAMRLAAAMLGVLTVAATYWAVKEMLLPALSQRRQKHPTRFAGKAAEGVALLAAVFIATSFWHVLMSRLGFRSISEPLIQTLALAALFRGLRLNRRRWIIIAGALIGLNLYTYLAARLFPVAIALIFLYIVLFDRGQRRERSLQFGLLVLAAASVFAPLGIYFLNHPAAFLTRIQQVAPHTGQAAALIDNVVRALGMFFVNGDPYIRFNLPGRPLFPWLLGILFMVGLGVTVVGVFRGRTFQRRLAYFSLITLSIIMLLPTALAVNEITPSNLRAIGLMPAVFVFPALGMWWLMKRMRGDAWRPTDSPLESRVWAGGRMKRLLSHPMSVAFTLSVVTIFASVETGVVYFGQYVREPQLYIQSDGDLADIANVLNHTDTSHDQVYIAALHYRHPTVAALTEKYSEVKWLTGNKAIVIPDGSAYLFFARLALPDQQWLSRFLPDSALVNAPLAPDGQTNYRVYHLAAQPTFTPQVKLDVNYGNIIQLLGYDVEPDQPASVTLYWRVLNRPPQGESSDYSTFAQLRDQWGFEWGQAGSFDYPSEEWSPGEIIINRIDVPVAAGAPPGNYELRVGWFSQSANSRLNIVAPDGGFGGTVARLSPISIVRAAADVSQLNIGTRLDLQVAPGLKLLGYSQETSMAQPGAPIYFTLYWQSTSKLDDEPLAIQLTSCGCARQPKATLPLTTTAPVQGTYPFSQWLPNEIVADRYAVRVPQDAPSTSYTPEIIVGAGAPIGLGEVFVPPIDRVLVEPPIDHRMDAKLGESIELVGYNLDRTTDAITLTLIWRGLKSIDQDYTVFTHVLDSSGKQIGGQDNQPVNGTYPTSQWAAGEYVIDPHEINLAKVAEPAHAQLSTGELVGRQAPQGYTIEVGLYDPETGARLGQTLHLH